MRKREEENNPILVGWKENNTIDKTELEGVPIGRQRSLTLFVVNE
jgi:hypothetical protein